MQPQSNGTPMEFFAAANGADGFRSYFDEIFPSDTLDGVFILKGGPGTGKSTLLKELAKAFSRPEIEAEIFYCSSDPASLDGLLLTHKDRRVAVLDGTAPHERDARLPGAADMLINLGDGFDCSALRKRKSEILSLQKKKSLAYKDAYFYLKLFGIFLSKIEAETESRLKKDAVLAWTKEHVFPHIQPKEPRSFSPRLIRAFSRDGIVRLCSYENNCEKHFGFFGDMTTCGILLRETLSILKDAGCGGLFAPSPFTHALIDGLLLKDEKIAICASNEEKNGYLPCTDFFSAATEENEMRLREYRAEGERFLALAKKALLQASEHHFALEHIYTPAMHFDRLSPIKAALKTQISTLLSVREFS